MGRTFCLHGRVCKGLGKKIRRKRTNWEELEEDGRTKLKLILINRVGMFGLHSSGSG